MVWYSHLFQNFPEFVVIHIVKVFCIVNKAKVDVFRQPSCFYGDPVDAGSILPTVRCLFLYLCVASVSGVFVAVLVCSFCVCCHSSTQERSPLVFAFSL